jgi:hypothetical protein
VCLLPINGVLGSAECSMPTREWLLRGVALYNAAHGRHKGRCFRFTLNVFK